MKIAEFSTNLRDLIGDPDAENSPRWTPETLLLWINEGRKVLFSLRAEAFFVSGIVRRYPGDLTAGQDLDIDPAYDARLLNYCAFRCLSRDNEDAETARLAQQYYGLFVNGV